MIFSDGTHSIGDPNIPHLTFTKVQVWGRMVRIPKVPCTKIMMTMSVLSCYKKRENLKKIKKREAKKRKK
jgi:hypothetical protein